MHTSSICLTMIVKNESKIIERCFDSVKDYIDTWCICDTGSTDGTQDIIKKYFEKHNIKGKLYEEEWVNFGHNRTSAVQHAQGMADFLLLMDADFVFQPINKKFKEKNLSEFDAYMVKYSGNLDFKQMLFVSGKIKWKYEGVTHEYIHSDEVEKIAMMHDFTFNHLYDGGSRADKYKRDVQLLEQGIKDEPDNVRYLFYLAQTYKDTDDFDNAIKYYTKRIEKKGWNEEIYCSMLQRALCKIKKGDAFNDFKDDLYNAYKYHPTRLEALYFLILICRKNNLFDLGYSLGLPAINTPYPSQELLFIIKDIHTWKFFNELALCAYQIGKPEISFMLYQRILKQHNNFSDEEKKELSKNLQMITQKVKHNQQKKDNLLSKVGVIILNHNREKQTDILYEQISKSNQDLDVVVVDLNSNKKSKYTNISLNKDVKISSGWNIGLNYLDSLESINNEKYYAYLFVIPTIEINEDEDYITEMVRFLKTNEDVVGIQPSLDNDSNSIFNIFNNTEEKDKEYLFFLNNIFTCYNAEWLNSNNRFSNELIHNFSSSVEIGYKAYRQGKKVILDNKLKIKETEKSLYGDITLQEINKSLGDYFTRKYNSTVIGGNISLKKDYKTKYVQEKIVSTNTGLTFLIRAKNEEKNVKMCLESLLEHTKDLDNIEIIYIDNNSNDDTYDLAKEFKDVKVLKYEKEVRKVGEKDEDKISIHEFYNWCLEQTSKDNIVKWDADFVANENLRDVILKYKLNKREDNFTLWLTGETLFEHNDIYYKKIKNTYDSFRVFSKRHNFKWKDFNNICEVPDYSDNVLKLKYQKPVFYEIFRTSIDEFSNKSMLIDNRDKIDNNIFESLKKNSAYIENNVDLTIEYFDKFSNKKDRKVLFIVYLGYFIESGGTYVTLKTYVEEFLKRNYIVFIFDKLPNLECVKKLNADCIISAQHANSLLLNMIQSFNVPLINLTFAPKQYTFVENFKYPSAVTYSNSFIKNEDTEEQKNGYIIRDPVNYKVYEISEEDMNRRYITLIGSPPNVKGHELFIELAKLKPELSFMLVTHKKEYEDKELPENIKFQPYLSTIKELKNKVYSKTRVLLMPSTQEAFGRVAIEATASCIPCIISDYPGLSEATYKMSNYIEDYTNIKEWKKELERVLGDYDNEVEKARNIKNALDYDKDVNSFVKLVENTISSF